MAATSFPISIARSVRVRTWGLYFAALILAAIVLLLSAGMMPLRFGDSFYFMPNAINYAAGDGLRHHCYPDGDPAGLDGRMVWHGYLMPLLYGTLLWEPTYRALFLLQAIVASLTLLLTSMLFAQVISCRAPALPWMAIVAAGLMLVGLVPPLLAGRPEPLATFFIVLALMLLGRLPMRYHPLVLGVGLALVGLTTPAGGVLSALLMGGYYSCRYRLWPAAIRYAASGAIALAVVLLVTQFVYPFGLADWIRGLQHNAQVGYWYEPIFPHWFFNPSAFMYGVLYLTSLGACGWFVWRYFSRVPCRTGLVVFGVAFLVWGYRWAVWMPNRMYNLLTFAPLVCLPILAAVADLKRSGAAVPRWRTLLVSIAVAALVGTPAVGTARLFVHCGLSWAGGMRYSEARRLIDQLRNDLKPGGIMLCLDIFALAEDQRGLDCYRKLDWRSGRTGAFKYRPFSSDILVLNQYKLARPDPPQLEGYELVADHFSHRAYSLFGIPFGRTPEAYNFAVYKKLRDKAAR